MRISISAKNRYALRITTNESSGLLANG